MSSLGSPNSFFLAGKKAYVVERSLRFNRSDSAHLTYTPGSASSDRTKVTISAWVKKCKNNEGEYSIFFGGTSSTNRAQLRFYTSSGFDNISFYARTSGTFILQLDTTAKFRDPSAWYHIVARCDTTNGTANIYVNGVEETSFTTSTKPSGSQSMEFFNNSEHQIGENGSSTSGTYMNGYMAEINVIQGQALDASYFGETDGITGQWNPKKYVGGYGDGFYLNFSDNSGTTATTLGKDSSGNGNNFTPNNFSVSAGVGNDSVEDTPTNNFPTLNPLFLNATEAAGTFSEGNLKVVTTGSEYGTALSTFSIRYGKYYWEVKQLGGSFATHGIVRGTTPNADCFVGYDPNGKLFGFGYNQGGNIKGASGTGTTSNANLATSLATFTTNNIIGFASDIPNGTLAIYKNNTLIYTITGINDDDWIPAISGYTSNGSYSINFGQQAFSYTPPTGYKKLNSANLPDPTILLPNKHFDTDLYTGTGSSLSRSAFNFQPDWLWFKSRSASGHNHALFDSVRGRAVGLSSDETYSEFTSSASNDLVSFDNDGFTLGGNQNFASVNGSGTKVAWAWNGGDTDGKTYTVKVVSDGGNKYRFDDFGTSAVTLDLAEGGTYIFDQSDSSNSGHPLRFSTTANGTHAGGSEYTTGVTTSGTPGSSGAFTQIVVAASAPTLYYYCTNHSGMGGQANTNSTLGSSNFDGTTQSTAKVNASAGFSIVTYTGTGSNTNIGHGLGVAPQVVITKARSATSGWAVLHTVGDPNAEFRLVLNDNGGYSSYQGGNLWNDTVPTSTYFRVSSDASTNASGVTYIAYVFSEVAGYSKFGKYKGNGSSDGTFIFTGFSPAFIMVKRTDSSNMWLMMDNKRYTHNVHGVGLKADTAEAEFGWNPSKDFLSNGFKIRTSDSAENANNATYIYFAFAESPFKNSRAR